MKDVGEHVGLLPGSGHDYRVDSEQNLLGEPAGSTVHEKVKKHRIQKSREHFEHVSLNALERKKFHVHRREQGPCPPSV